MKSDRVLVKEEDKVIIILIDIILEFIIIIIEVISVISIRIKLGVELLVAIKGLFNTVESNRVKEDKDKL